MICSFGDRATEALFHGRRGRATKRLPPDVLRVALRKLDMLNVAKTLHELMIPRKNRLEALRGDVKGLHSIRINDQWRLVFRWQPGEAHEVRIVDYHG